jgi:hypothetical protein
VSGAKVLQFRRPAQKLVETKVDGVTRVSGFASTLQARPDGVFFTVHNVEFELTAEQARELGATLIECADDSDSLETGPKA